ncbi:thioredoxin [Chitinophaga barathri]|uniref:Thioredoxin n=2 Tax=Chitinophaga barathri TaxID=1647451 RepID=A0A3N4M9Y6_9BACT|nr:thioredoxin [Chitinophaga barathri]
MAQSSHNHAAQSKQLKGEFKMKQLLADSAFTWFHNGVNRYDANSTMVNYIKSNKDKIQLVALVNTTDEASQNLLGRFYKVMILASVPEESIHMYGADNSGNTGNDVADGYKIKRVPTILVMRDGKEEGRISGNSKESVEQDLAQIIMKMNKKD